MFAGDVDRVHRAPYPALPREGGPLPPFTLRIPQVHQEEASIASLVRFPVLLQIPTKCVSFLLLFTSSFRVLFRPSVSVGLLYCITHISVAVWRRVIGQSSSDASIFTRVFQCFLSQYIVLNQWLVRYTNGERKIHDTKRRRWYIPREPGGTVPAKLKTGYCTIRTTL